MPFYARLLFSSFFFYCVVAVHKHISYHACKNAPRCILEGSACLPEVQPLLDSKVFGFWVFF